MNMGERDKAPKRPGQPSLNDGRETRNRGRIAHINPQMDTGIILCPVCRHDLSSPTGLALAPSDHKWVGSLHHTEGHPPLS
jgi:hypothetical protein